MSRVIENVPPVRQEFRAMVSHFPTIFETPQSQWGLGAVRLLVAGRRQLAEASPPVREYLTPIIERGINLLRATSNGSAPHTDHERAVMGERLIMQLSREMAAPFAHETGFLQERFVPIEQLIEEHPDQLRLDGNVSRGEIHTSLGIRNPVSGLWFDVPLPRGSNVWHKGGVARAVMDVYAGSPQSMLASELPWNDLDIVASGDEAEIRREADEMGVDPEGVEIVDELSPYRFFVGRDTTQNMVALSRDGLIYTDQSFEAAKTGRIDISSSYTPEKAIYNTDRFLFIDPETGETILLPKQRGQMRLLKMVAEGKALSFSWMDLSRNLNLGIYSLYLAKRWSRKPNFGELMGKMQELLVRMGHEERGINIMDTLEAVHADFPFFDFDKDIVGMDDVVRWKARKLVKQMDREFWWVNREGHHFTFTRTSGDTDIRAVDLEGYVGDQESVRRFLDQWPDFLEAARSRTRAYKRVTRVPAESIFYSNDVDQYARSA